MEDKLNELYKKKSHIASSKSTLNILVKIFNVFSSFIIFIAAVHFTYLVSNPSISAKQAALNLIGYSVAFIILTLCELFTQVKSDDKERKLYEIEKQIALLPYTF